MMNAAAREIAERFIAEQDSPWSYEFMGVVRAVHFPDELSVLFRINSPDGSAFDGPVIVIVNEVSESARFFDSP